MRQMTGIMLGRGHYLGVASQRRPPFGASASALTTDRNGTLLIDTTVLPRATKPQTPWARV
jgi:hypothetical protein